MQGVSVLRLGVALRVHVRVESMSRNRNPFSQTLIQGVSVEDASLRYWGSETRLRLKVWDSTLSTVRRRGHGLGIRGGGSVGSGSRFRTWRSRVEA